MHIKKEFYGYDGIPEVQEFVSNSLKEIKVDSKQRIRIGLALEDGITALYSKHRAEYPEDTNPCLSVSMKRFLGNITLEISMSGYALDENCLYGAFNDIDDEAAETVRGIMRKVSGEFISHRRSHDINKVILSVQKSPYSTIIATLGAMLVGILFGVIVRAVAPTEATQVIANDIFGSINTMFFNALKMLVAPLVFFAISSSISEFTDLKALGRLGGKVIGWFLATSLAALFMGIGMYYLFPIGNESLRNAAGLASEAVKSGVDISESGFFKDMLINIVPSNFANAFVKADMLQIIFIAVLSGAAASKLSDKAAGVKRALAACNEWFNKMMLIIIRLMPLIVFCSLGKLTMTLDMSNMSSLMSLLGLVYLTDIVCLLMFAIILAVFGRTDPFEFYRKFGSVMLAAASFASSNATVPFSIEACRDRLKISPKLYSFSIPLGATINMNGSCILQSVVCLFMARTFGIDMTGSMIFTMIILIFVLTVGAPGVPGGALVVMASIFPSLGIPVEAVNLIVGMYPLFAMFMVMLNSTGDAVVTMTVAKREGLIEQGEAGRHEN